MKSAKIEVPDLDGHTGLVFVKGIYHAIYYKDRTQYRKTTSTGNITEALKRRDEIHSRTPSPSAAAMTIKFMNKKQPKTPTGLHDVICYDSLLWVTNYPKSIKGMWPRRMGVVYIEGPPKASELLPSAAMVNRGLVGAYVDMVEEEYRKLPLARTPADMKSEKV